MLVRLVPALLLPPAGFGRTTSSCDAPFMSVANEALIRQAKDCMPARSRGLTKSSEIAPCTSKEKDDMCEIGGQFSSTYGEISDSGFSVLAERMRLGPNDVFTDCGSGLGSVCLQAARDFGVRESIGVEYAASRHNVAVARLDENSRVQLLQGDCAEPALWSAGGACSASTCVYTCNVLCVTACQTRDRTHAWC